jgi:hypothetical protein
LEKRLDLFSSLQENKTISILKKKELLVRKEKSLATRVKFNFLFLVLISEHKYERLNGKEINNKKNEF